MARIERVELRMVDLVLKVKRTDAIQSFVSAYGATGDARWLDHARSVAAYVRAFLESPDGGFYASQDADVPTTRGVLHGAEYYALGDAERRALGLPRTDTTVYAAATGILIDAFARLAEVDPEGPWLASAIAAANRMEVTHRRGEGFVHAAHEPEGTLLHLADQAHMARGLATLGEVTADARWFALAGRTLAFAERELRDAQHGGFFAHTADPNAVGVFRERQKPIELNAVLAELQALLDAQYAAFNRACVGLTLPVLLERAGRHSGQLVGRLRLDETLRGRQPALDSFGGGEEPDSRQPAPRAGDPALDERGHIAARDRSLLEPMPHLGAVEFEPSHGLPNEG